MCVPLILFLLPSPLATCGQDTALMVGWGKEGFSSSFLLLLTSRVTYFIVWGQGQKGQIPPSVQPQLSFLPLQRTSSWPVLLEVVTCAWGGLRRPTFQISCFCSGFLVFVFIVRPTLEGLFVHYSSWTHLVALAFWAVIRVEILRAWFCSHEVHTVDVAVLSTRLSLGAETHMSHWQVPPRMRVEEHHGSGMSFCL